MPGLITRLLYNPCQAPRGSDEDQGAGPCIVQGPMAAAWGDSERGCQPWQAVGGEAREGQPRKGQAVEGRIGWRLDASPSGLHGEEAEVERRVVRDKGRVAREFDEAGHDLGE